MRIAVAGATGVLGRHVMDVLRERGSDPVAIARSAGVDLVAGTGVDAALEGVEVVIDASNRSTLNRRAAESFFEATTGNLLAAGRRAGVRHLVVVSIVGIDRVDTGYFAGKRRHEAVALAGDLPVTVQRITQFHEFAEQVMSRGGVGPLRLVPRARVQPVAAREAAEVLADLAVTDPVGRAPDLAGPEVHDLVDVARRVVRARGRRWVVAPVPVPGAPGRAMRAGGLLPEPGARLGRVTLAQWLAEPTA